MREPNQGVRTYHARIFLCLLFFALVLFHLFLTLQTAGPVILDDELGYLANAAYLTGLDWSNSVGRTYYAFGYSLFLVPFFPFVKDGQTLYHAAQILNGIFASFVFLLAYRLGIAYAPHAKKLVVGSVALAVSLYPSSLLYAHTALSESLLICMYWVSVLFSFYIAEKKRSVLYFYLFGILVACLYAIHQRAICILVSSTFIILLLWYRRWVDRQRVFAFFSSVSISAALVFVTHQYFKNEVWQQHLSYNFAGRISGAVMNVQGLKTWLVAACGQMFYLGVASCLLVFIGLGVALYSSFGLFTHFHRNRALKPDSFIVPEPERISLIYMGLSFLLFFLTSVTFCYKGISNFVLYGRYNEAVIGPLILIGLLTASRCLEKRISWKTLFFCVTVLLLITFPPYYSGRLGTGPIFNVQIVGLSLFKKTNGHIAIWQAFFATAFFSSILFAVLKWRPTLGTLLLSIFFLFVAREGIRDHILAGAHVWKHMTNITQWLNHYHRDEPVYFLSREDRQSDLMKKRYQIWLKDEKLKTLKDLNQVKTQNVVYLITTRKDVQSHIPDARLLVTEKNGSFSLWVLSKEKSNELDKQGVLNARNIRLEDPAYPETGMPLNAYRAKLELAENRSFSVACASPQYLWIINKLEMVQNVSGIRAWMKKTMRDAESVHVKITHMGADAAWAQLIRVGIVWQPADGSGKRLGEQRASLPSSLEPGEETEVEFILEPVDYNGKPLPTGRYIVLIDMVHENVTWFNSRGLTAPLRLNVVVGTRAG